MHLTLSVYGILTSSSITLVNQKNFVYEQFSDYGATLFNVIIIIAQNDNWSEAELLSIP